MSLPVRVLIADNDTTFAETLARYLDDRPKYRVVGIVRDGQGAVDLARSSWPDVIVIDLHLPVLDSIRAIQAILAHNDRIKILGLSAKPDDRYAVEAIKAGASGCMDKHTGDACRAIFQAIGDILNGEVLLNPALASSILKEFHRFSE